MQPKRLALLGSTGSVGEQSLAVAEAFPERYRVVALAAGRRIEKLADQVRRFRPELVSVAEAAGAEGLRGRLGPDLSDVGWIRSPQHLETSLLEPGKVLHPRYRTVVVVTKEAVEYRGVLRNEDTYSIQFLDEMENLRSFDKSELERIDKPEESLMPSFGGFFRGRDLDHLVAYLYSLKEK